MLSGRCSMGRHTSVRRSGSIRRGLSGYTCAVEAKQAAFQKPSPLAAEVGHTAIAAALDAQRLVMAESVAKLQRSCFAMHPLMDADGPDRCSLGGGQPATGRQVDDA